MPTFTIAEAQAEFLELVARAEAGEEIVIARGKEPVVRLAPIVANPVKRKPGLLKGQVEVPDSFFFDPLPEEELKLWEGSYDDPFR